MPYKVKILPSFSRSAFEADSNLYALSPKAADKYFEDYNHKIELIQDNPKLNSYEFQNGFLSDKFYPRGSGITILCPGVRLYGELNPLAFTICCHGTPNICPIRYRVSPDATV